MDSLQILLSNVLVRFRAPKRVETPCCASKCTLKCEVKEQEEVYTPPLRASRERERERQRERRPRDNREKLKMYLALELFPLKEGSPSTLLDINSLFPRFVIGKQRPKEWCLPQPQTEHLSAAILESPQTAQVARLARFSSVADHVATTPWSLQFHGEFTGIKTARITARRIGFDSRSGRPTIFACASRDGRWLRLAGFPGDLPFPLPLQSDAAPFSPRFTLIGSQDLYVKCHPNFFTHTYVPLEKESRIFSWKIGNQPFMDYELHMKYEVKDVDCCCNVKQDPSEKLGTRRQVMSWQVVGVGVEAVYGEERVLVLHGL
ncbi:hypothetical protein PR048_022583 [Dryococelus australis]|uniref:Uncharacterized protein n=1 Tax=Dryococelus australis TaxID=614101 RepID=A0ABQ9H1D8_9NEOP|nr:hypothetical protein PR048_022583 [Dryococelus australis]